MAADSPHARLAQITHSLHAYAKELRAGGVEGFPPAPSVTHPSSSAILAGQDSPGSTADSRVEMIEYQSQQATDAPAPTKTFPASDAAAPTAPAGEASLAAVNTLAELRTEIGDCQRCRLCERRNTIVFGVGNPDAEIMFIGEGPGYEEDRQGEPFVGRAGQLLTQIITKGMQMQRSDVYIANVVKCRPPENRNPEPDEIAACEPFLAKQLEIIRPKVIIALGKFAAQTLLKDTTPITRLRGKWQSYHGIKLMPTLHPAYLLRNPKDKRLVWEDIKAVLRETGRL